MAVFTQPGPFPVPACSKMMDITGDHALACADSQERLARHNCLRDSLFSLSSQARLGPRKEEPDLLSGNSMRLGDVLLPGWFQGKDAALDVTVVTPIQDKLTERAAQTPGAAAEKAHNDKLGKYYDKCLQEGIEFIPLAVEPWGSCYPKARETIKALATQMAKQVGSDEQVIVTHVRQRLGILLQRGNAALISSRIPDFPSPELDGDLDLDADTYIPLD